MSDEESISDSHCLRMPSLLWQTLTSDVTHAVLAARGPDAFLPKIAVFEKEIKGTPSCWNQKQICSQYSGPQKLSESPKYSKSKMSFHKHFKGVLVAVHACFTFKGCIWILNRDVSIYVYHYEFITKDTDSNLK